MMGSVSRRLPKILGTMHQEASEITFALLKMVVSHELDEGNENNSLTYIIMLSAKTGNWKYQAFELKGDSLRTIEPLDVLISGSKLQLQSSILCIVEFEGR